jgi:hypothetical protein
MNREQLKEYLGRQVICTGVFEGSNTFDIHDNGSAFPRKNRVAIIIDLKIEAEHNKDEIYYGHAHVQWANDIIDLKPKKGDKVIFTAEVIQYMRKDIEGNKTIPAIGLSNPRDTEITEFAPFPNTDIQPVSAPVIISLDKEEDDGITYKSDGSLNKSSVIEAAMRHLGPHKTFKDISDYVFEKHGFTPTYQQINYAKNKHREPDPNKIKKIDMLFEAFAALGADAKKEDVCRYVLDKYKVDASSNVQYSRMRFKEENGSKEPINATEIKSSLPSNTVDLILAVKEIGLTSIKQLLQVDLKLAKRVSELAESAGGADHLLKIAEAVSK